MDNIRRLAILLPVSVLTLSCGSATPEDQPGLAAAPEPAAQPSPQLSVNPAPNPFELKVGKYGGEEAELTYNADGSASVKLTCGEGVIRAPILIDRSGTWEGEGSFKIMTGTPPPGGFQSRSASYIGVVLNNTLQMFIDYKDASGRIVALAPFDLKYGQPATHTLVCTAP